MEDAPQVRRAARAAVKDTYPERLAARIRQAIDDTSMVPGVLVLRSARLAKLGHETTSEDGSAAQATTDRSPSSVSTDTDGLWRQAAGVQLIYEGLRLTRALADGEPWENPETSEERTEADIAILAADVLVARGFRILARTDVAGQAVETVRRFGRDQTTGREADADTTVFDPTLEADAIDLALRCGFMATDRPIPDSFPAVVADLTDALTVRGRDRDAVGFRAPEEGIPLPDSLLASSVDRPTDASEGIPPATDR